MRTTVSDHKVDVVQGGGRAELLRDVYGLDGRPDPNFRVRPPGSATVRTRHSTVPSLTSLRGVADQLAWLPQSEASVEAIDVTPLPKSPATLVTSGAPNWSSRTPGRT